MSSLGFVKSVCHHHESELN